MKRHVIAIIFFLISTFYIDLGTFIIFSPAYWDNANYPDFNDAVWAALLKIIFASQGIFLPITRLAEPYFYQILATKVKSALQNLTCCCGFKEAHKKKL